MHALLKRNYLSHSGKAIVMNSIMTIITYIISRITHITHWPRWPRVPKALASNNHVGDKNPQWAHKDKSNGVQSKGWHGGISPCTQRNKRIYSKPAARGKQPVKGEIIPLAERAFANTSATRAGSEENSWGGSSSSVRKGNNLPLLMKKTKKTGWLVGRPNSHSHHRSCPQPSQVVRWVEPLDFY